MKGEGVRRKIRGDNVFGIEKCGKTGIHRKEVCVEETEADGGKRKLIVTFL